MGGCNGRVQGGWNKNRKQVNTTDILTGKITRRFVKGSIGGTKSRDALLSLLFPSSSSPLTHTHIHTLPHGSPSPTPSNLHIHTHTPFSSLQTRPTSVVIKMACSDPRTRQSIRYRRCGLGALSGQVKHWPLRHPRTRARGVFDQSAPFPVYMLLLF